MGGLFLFALPFVGFGTVKPQGQTLHTEHGTYTVVDDHGATNITY
jgi:hypothetical protein